MSCDRLRDEDLLKDAVTALLRPLLRTDVLPRRIEVAGVVEMLVPGVSQSELSSEGEPFELSCSADCAFVFEGCPRAEATLRVVIAGMDTSLRTRRALDGGSVFSSSTVSSSWSDEFGTKVRVRFCEWRRLVVTDLLEEATNNVNEEPCGRGCATGVQAGCCRENVLRVVSSEGETALLGPLRSEVRVDRLGAIMRDVCRQR
jgi:hypothetical protein